MNILAVDSSGLAASAAVLSDDVIRSEYTVCNKLTHSETLMPMIDEVVKSSGLALGDMDAIAIAMGPGSFTGLRIGSATVKGLAEAIGRPVIEVPTVNALAQNMAGYDGNIVPLMDARRNETYTGIFTFAGGDLRVLREQCAVPLNEILADVNGRGNKTVFLGDGIRVFADQIKDICTVPYILAPPGLRLQRASSVAVLAQRYYEEGRCIDPAGHVPTYLRVSQAEREMSDKASKGEKDRQGITAADDSL